MAQDPKDTSIIDQLAGQKLGDVNQQVQQTVNAEVAKAQSVADTAGGDGATPEEVPTPLEQANEAVSPKTEADNQKDEAFIQIAFGENDSRTLSEKQIRDTYDRYRNLNYQHQTEVAPNKPILDFVTQIKANVKQETGQDVKADDIVQFLQAASMAYMKNPTMGGQNDPTPDSPGIPLGDLEKEMAQWEEDNAVSLPPQYKQAAGMMQGLQNENAQIKQMLMNIQQSSQGLAQNAQNVAINANATQADAMRQLAANNLDQAQAQLGLADDLQTDFFNFAYGRGYTVEDFIDPQLTMQVASDFKNNINSPELERMKGIAQRRQAFTGNISGTPNAAGTATPQPDQNQQFIDTVTADIMKKRNMA